MPRWFVFALVIVQPALGACRAHGAAAAQGSRSPPATNEKPASDRVFDLLPFLPVGSDRCVVMRTAQLTAAQRSLFLPVSQSEARPFWPELEVTAYAEGVRERREGRPFQVSLFWLNASESEVRAALARQVGSRLVWDANDDACNTEGCPARARFAAPGVLRIERGAETAGSSAGAETHCGELARKNLRALELSYSRSRALLSIALGVLPLTGRSVVTPTTAGVHVRRVDLMRGSEDAEQVVSDPSAADLLLGPLGALASGLRRQRQDAEVQTDYDLSWEDLEFASEADARVRAAENAAPALERAQLDSKLEPRSREEVIARLGQRLERMRELAGDERLVQARAAQSLLERALERDPEDEGLALLLTELFVTELAAPESARVLVQRFLPKLGSRARWPELERHAAALLGQDSLATALLAAKLTEARRARTVAAEIIARMREGAGYLEAERAVLGQRAQTP